MVFDLKSEIVADTDADFATTDIYDGQFVTRRQDVRLPECDATGNVDIE